MDTPTTIIATNSNTVSKRESKDTSMAKYNLRTKSIQNRIEVERRKNEPRHPKPKQKPAPLSKYRRKTANFRERCRMQEMNDAFKRLQSVVPEVLSAEQTDKSALQCNNKVTKINTLKLAVNYISALTQMLNQNETDGHSLPRTNSENVPAMALLHHHQQQPQTTKSYNINKCQIEGLSSTTTTTTISSAISHSLISRHKDLSQTQSEAISHRTKVPCFTSENAHLLPEANKMIGSCQDSCLSRPAYGVVNPIDLNHDNRLQPPVGHSVAPCGPLHGNDRLYVTSNPILEPSFQPSDTFDLNAFSLAADDLDDFSAIIDDLRDDNFSLVDGLID